MEDETQQRLKEMQDLCNQRVDEVAKATGEQQRARRVAALLHDRAEAERTWYSARQQEQAELLKLQTALPRPGRAGGPAGGSGWAKGRGADSGAERATVAGGGSGCGSQASGTQPGGGR
uniref:MIP-T3_C domain-containing protein n=1 Tax=Macrostomum lignano TaxID=282301 RepID=A0A1I8FCS7_9PLAT